ncbi:SH3 domain-containing protein [Roseovarius sp.]|uniref:SH3 domain-containing protein n=1 Tax=Roseovarius sp. TaxID=1486281 RepID=UPI003A97BE4C
MLRPLVLAAALLALATPAFAASTARATGNLPIRSGPGDYYRTISTLPDGTRVGLSQCTRHSRWCKIVYDDGPDGWVLGSYLVGSPAKARVTPPDFSGRFLDFGF